MVVGIGVSVVWHRIGMGWHSICIGLATDWHEIDDGLTPDRHWIGIGLTSNRHRIGLNGAGVVRLVLRRSRPERCLWHWIVLRRDTSVGLYSTLVPLLLAGLSSDWPGMCQFVSICCQSYVNPDLKIVSDRCENRTLYGNLSGLIDNGYTLVSCSITEMSSSDAGLRSLCQCVSIQFCWLLPGWCVEVASGKLVNGPSCSGSIVSPVPINPMLIQCHFIANPWPIWRQLSADPMLITWWFANTHDISFANSHQSGVN